MCYLSLLSRFDHLVIFNEHSVKFGVYCGERTGHTVLVNGNYVVITFYSDEKVQLKGFLLVFAAVQIGKYKARSPQQRTTKGDQAPYFLRNAVSRKLVPWSGHPVRHISIQTPFLKPCCFGNNIEKALRLYRD